MKVVLLCGGVGTRMFPITEDKFLLKFVGKTLLEHQIEMAKNGGLTEFVIIGNPQNIGKIEQVVANVPGIQVNLAMQREPLGIADALDSASQYFNKEIIVVNPNDVFDISAYTGLLEASRSEPGISYLLGRQVSEYFPGGYLVASKEGELTHIVEKPERGKEPSNLVNILIHLHKDPKRLLKYAANIKTNRDDVYERAIDAMARRDTSRIKVVPYEGLWNAIKYPWHIFSVVRQFLGSSENYISPSAVISDKATISGSVIIDQDVKVLENVVIRGPAYIGPNTVIGNNTLVRDYSHIGANCVVGNSTEVKGSYIGDRCWFHMNYIGDSIIGDGCSFGAGTILANFRFDEGNISVRIDGEPVDTGLNKFGAIIGSNSKTGVNVSIMPGTKVGPNSTVGPQVCLTEDLEPDSTILAASVGKTTGDKFQMDEERGHGTIMRTRGLKCVE